jgi:prepilin-type N-terminal cleavage/methylation domain-containing protein
MNKSFTLIEILVVIVVIGVLSAFILVGMNSISDSANIGKGQAFSSSLKNSLLLNLVSEWKMDEGTGTSVNDFWSGSNNGTLTCGGAVACWQTTNCINGSCLKFDGDDAITINTVSNYNLNAATQTIEAWINLNSWNTSVNTLVRSNGTTQDWYWVFYGGGGGATTNTIYSLIFYTDNSFVDTAYVYPRKLISLGKWYHAVLNLDSSGIATFYLNGAIADTRSATNFLRWGRFNAPTSTVAVVIGSAFLGTIDNVRMYNSSIPTSQVQQNYYSGLNRLFVKNNFSEEEYVKNIKQFIAHD